MVHEESLSAVLREFARTLTTDFPIQAILDAFVVRILDVLPVTGAGVTLITEGQAPHYVAASDADALRFEQLQTALDQGPCLSAYWSGTAVSVPDLRTETRFPQFIPQAVAAGLAAVFTFPLCHPDGRLGALDLYRDTPGELPPKDLIVAQTLADVVVAYLLNARAREDARTSSGGAHRSIMHDPLTGLPNRLLLEQRMEHAAHRASRSHHSAAILFADLDRFTQVNDADGYPIGDQALVAVAARLGGLMRPGDTLARFAEDQFVFLCEDLHNPADADALAQRIAASFVQPFELGTQQITLGASIGVAFAGPGQEISPRLITQAEVEMLRSRRSDGAQHQNRLRSVTVAAERDRFETDLRSALAHDRLELAYQPIVRISDGRVTGVEALLRWTDVERGLVSAAEMVAVAERSGLIADIGAWVLERACRDRQGWLLEQPRVPLDLAVNVSARQVMRPGFCAFVDRVLTRAGMPPDALVLEITEHVLLEDSERAIGLLTDLKDLGVRLALDDFGTGYSSLSYLRRMPIDIVKIDQSFIADIDGTPGSLAIATAVTKLAHVLNLTVTAEGVEAVGQHEAVRRMGCESGQGTYYAWPMSAGAVAVRLGKRATNTVPFPGPRQQTA